MDKFGGPSSLEGPLEPFQPGTVQPLAHLPPSLCSPHTPSYATVSRHHHLHFHAMWDSLMFYENARTQQKSTTVLIMVRIEAPEASQPHSPLLITEGFTSLSAPCSHQRGVTGVASRRSPLKQLHTPMKIWAPLMV